MTMTSTGVAATPRTRSQQLLDRLATRLLRLPPPTTSYTVTRDLPVPMHDGVELLTDMYEPTASTSRTILVRSPYGWSGPIATLTGAVYACRGYRVLLGKCHGTRGSGGVFEPMIHEVDDAADTVAWMHEQPWFEGRFVTCGGSYLGFTQWALLMDPPPSPLAPSSPSGRTTSALPRTRGRLQPERFPRLVQPDRPEEEGGFVRGLVRGFGANRDLARGRVGGAVVEAGERLLEGRAPWYRNGSAGATRAIRSGRRCGWATPWTG